MQLKDRRRRFTRDIGTPLAAATCALLGQGVPAAVHAQELAPWEVDTSLLIYSESDGRVRDTSLSARARKELKEEKFLDLTLAIDSLTGASPSGATPASVVQTFTSPSGESEYTVSAGAHALDTSFLDTRTALSATWTMPVTRLALLSVGASLSDEYDYTHTGVNARLARDFNNRNTTLSFGVALANDTIDPVGGSPAALTPMLGLAPTTKLGDQSKDVTDWLIGVTQVLSRHTIVQINYSLSQSDGYLTDPYKILSVVDPVTGDPVAGPLGTGRYRYLYERRPETRDKQSVYALLKHDFDGDVLETSYRYMSDDWGVDSHTLELRYRWSFGGARYLQPHVRFYQQTAAEFYRTVLFDGAPLPAFATADHRLGEFDGLTVGLKYGQPTARGGEWSARIEYYTQSGNASPGSAVGSLANFDLYPDLNALIAQFSYKFGRR